MTHDFTTVMRAGLPPLWRIECTCDFRGVWFAERARLVRSIAIHLADVAGDYVGSVAMVRHPDWEKYMPEARAILAEIGAE